MNQLHRVPEKHLSCQGSAEHLALGDQNTLQWSFLARVTPGDNRWFYSTWKIFFDEESSATHTRIWSPRQGVKGLEVSLARTLLIFDIERYKSRLKEVCTEPVWFRWLITVCWKNAVDLGKKSYNSESVILNRVLHVLWFMNLVTVFWWIEQMWNTHC